MPGQASTQQTAADEDNADGHGIPGRIAGRTWQPPSGHHHPQPDWQQEPTQHPGYVADGDDCHRHRERACQVIAIAGDGSSAAVDVRRAHQPAARYRRDDEMPWPCSGDRLGLGC